MKVMDDYKEQLDKEIEARIKIMEQEEYSFPQRFSKMDYLVLFGVVIICLAAIVIGVTL